MQKSTRTEYISKYQCNDLYVAVMTYVLSQYLNIHFEYCAKYGDKITALCQVGFFVLAMLINLLPILQIFAINAAL